MTVTGRFQISDKVPAPTGTPFAEGALVTPAAAMPATPTQQRLSPPVLVDLRT
jgi:hypothetical protein